MGSNDRSTKVARPQTPARWIDLCARGMLRILLF